MKPIALAALVFAGMSTVAQAAPISLVAAENFYGDVAKQIGGSNVAVTSILSNPDDDPHLFEASPTTAKALADAKLVILNGADYDPWMDKLLAANPVADRKVDRRRRSRASQIGRQPPSLVRSRDHAHGCEGAGRAVGGDRSGA